MSAAYVMPAQHSQEYSTPTRVGDYHLRLRWLPTLALGAAAALCVALGFWQLDRAEEKRQQVSELARQALMPALALRPLEASAEPLRYRHLRATGTFEEAGQILIENRHHAGQTGYHVITPLRIDGGEVRVLVNRGWIPADAQGRPTPAPVPDGPRTVNGEAHIPAPPAIALTGSAGAAAWGNRWPYLTLDLYRGRFGFPVQPVVILMDPSEPDGFARSWPPEMPKEGMHLGYAVQWFAFAAIALVVWLRLSVGRRDGEGGPP
jgi:surfeit locus 1 family protein